jgi:putative transposon-encoded protein
MASYLPFEARLMGTVSQERSLMVDADKKKQPDKAPPDDTPMKVRLEIYGKEMIEKRVKSSGKSGRVYLPSEWVGLHVKIIRID